MGLLDPAMLRKDEVDDRSHAERGGVLLMTGKGISTDELQMRLIAVFGKEDVTVDEFLGRAKELGVTASDLAAIIENEREMARILLNDRRPLKTE